MRHPERGQGANSDEDVYGAPGLNDRAAIRKSDSTDSITATSPPTSRANPQPRVRFSDEHRALIGILNEACRASGLSQKAVSRLLGKPHNHMQFVESNDRDLTFVEVAHICEIVELPLGELVERYVAQVKVIRLARGASSDAVEPQNDQ